MDEIEVGDYVTVGLGTLTWEVLVINEKFKLAKLKSGFSGRRQWQALDSLKLHTKGRK